MLEDLLNRALKHESNAEWDLAVSYYKRALTESPGNKEALFNYGGCLFNMCKYEDALEILVECYRHPLQSEEVKKVIFQQILSAYYLPNEPDFRAAYEKNMALLKTYEHNYLQNIVSFEELPFYYIPASDTKYYIWEKETGLFHTSVLTDKFKNKNDINEFASPDNIVAAINVFNEQDLENISARTVDPSWHDGKMTPVYLIWTEPALVYLFMQIIDYDAVIAGKRVVFFDSYAPDSSFENYLKDHQAMLPTSVVGDQRGFQTLNQLLTQIVNYRNEDIKRKKAAIEEYYGAYTWEFYRKLFNKREMRILFLTSRFSDVIQYTARDMWQACREQGITCELLMEKSFLHRCTYDVYIDKIYEFRPDVIFLISHLKTQLFMEFPENLMFVSWIQDPVPSIYSSEHASQFGKFDFILSHSKYFTEQMVKTGFPEVRITALTVPTDDNIFRQYDLTADERGRFTADVAVCANYNTIPEKLLQKWINGLPKGVPRETENMLREIYNTIEHILQNGQFITNKMQCMDIIKEVADRFHLQGLLNMDEWAEAIYLRLAYGMHRKYVIKAIIASGVKFKLWGNHWGTDPEFAPYARGWVRHGEELAKVYSCSRIVVCSSSHHTAHFRVWESLLCGPLCMIQYVPPEYDLLDIRDYLTEGEDFVFYYNHNDLVEKIRYYLEHEEERKHIVENGQKRVKEKLTYKVAVNYWLEFIKNSINTDEL